MILEEVLEWLELRIGVYTVMDPTDGDSPSRGGAAGEVEAPAAARRGTVAQHAASGLVVTVDTAGNPHPLATRLRGPFRTTSEQRSRTLPDLLT